MKITTKRLIITPATLEEMKNKRDSEPDAELRKAYSEMIDSMKALPGQEEWASDWFICLDSGAEIGGIGFKGSPDENGNVEIGYGIDEKYRKNGYATEAVNSVTAWALSQSGVKRVVAQTEPDNAASQRVLFKNGFKPCGTGEEGPLFEKKL